MNTYEQSVFKRIKSAYNFKRIKSHRKRMRKWNLDNEKAERALKKANQLRKYYERFGRTVTFPEWFNFVGHFVRAHNK